VGRVQLVYFIFVSFRFIFGWLVGWFLMTDFYVLGSWMVAGLFATAFGRSRACFPKTLLWMPVCLLLFHVSM
jgi:hypothetical protein